MTFISGKFFVFLFALIILYYIIPVKLRWLVLLAGSIYFYATYGVKRMVYIIGATLLAYLGALWMNSIYTRSDERIEAEDLPAPEKRRRKAVAKGRCKIVLWFFVAILLLILVFCKTETQVFALITRMMRLEQPLDWMQVIVPLGVSYYTFSLVGYLANVYWRKEKAERNPLRLMLFAIYFPKILQGPIANHKNLAPQLNAEHRFDYTKVCYGFQLAIYGYFKKMVIADRLAIFTSSIFDINTYMDKSGLIFVIGALAASMQLYCDFSGCMDIAEGVSEIFGITLEKNFDHPFFSKTAAEFWRRWHATLGAWFKDYIFMPLAISPKLMKCAQNIKKVFGPRASKAFMTIIPTALVWLLTGLWHGTGYNYIAWGIYWGFIIIMSSVFAPEIKKLTNLLHINTEAGSWKVFQMVRTYVLFSFGRLLTVPGHLRTTWDILKKIGEKFDIWILFDGSLYNYGLNQKNFNLVLFSCFVVWCVSMLQQRGCLRDRIASCNIVFRWAIYYIALFSVIIFGMYGAGYSASTFIYAAF